MKTNINKPMNRIAATMALLLASGMACADNSNNMGAEVRDAYREGQIWATYVANPTLESYELDIDVQGNKAVLTGNVETLIEKNLAERIALRTDGIKSVDNRIVVDPVLVITVSDEPTFADFVADATIEAMINSKLLWNSHTDALDISVGSLNGLVTLTGAADTPHSLATAARLAASTPGVIGVDNKLVLDTADGQVAIAQAADGDSALSNTWVAAKVNSMLLWSNGVDGTDIDVRADDGVVTLRGTVDSVFEKRLAIELAQDVRGVEKVDASGLQMISSEIADRS